MDIAVAVALNVGKVILIVQHAGSFGGRPTGVQGYHSFVDLHIIGHLVGETGIVIPALETVAAADGSRQILIILDPAAGLGLGGNDLAAVGDIFQGVIVVLVVIGIAAGVLPVCGHFHRLGGHLKGGVRLRGVGKRHAGAGRPADEGVVAAAAGMNRNGFVRFIETRAGIRGGAVLNRHLIGVGRVHMLHFDFCGVAMCGGFPAAAVPVNDPAQRLGHTVLHGVRTMFADEQFHKAAGGRLHLIADMAIPVSFFAQSPVLRQAQLDGIRFRTVVVLLRHAGNPNVLFKSVQRRLHIVISRLRRARGHNQGRLTLQVPVPAVRALLPLHVERIAVALVPAVIGMGRSTGLVLIRISLLVRDGHGCGFVRAHNHIGFRRNGGLVVAVEGNRLPVMAVHGFAIHIQFSVFNGSFQHVRIGSLFAGNRNHNRSPIVLSQYDPGLAGAVIIPHDFPGRLRTGNNLVFAIFSLIISISLIHILGVVHRHGAGVRIGSLGIFVLIVYNIAQCVATVHKAQTVEAIDVLGNLIAFQNDCKLFRAALAYIGVTIRI